ncbi:sensor histidine kinase [Rhodococcoides corynebacterioides]|uniref:sensor histidine kinase n=1 Tax=Rhodococcoides corynebacterioides TaxID=53972 RepID=UPI003F80FB0F
MAVDVLLVLVSAVDALVGVLNPTPAEAAVATLACAVLPARRSYPVAVFVATLPGLITDTAFLAAVFALGTVAATDRRRWVVSLCGAVMFGSSLIWVVGNPSWTTLVTTVLAAASYAITPVAVGLLIRTRNELTARLADLEAARDTDRETQASLVLATERARLAREMHDVVAHQVSLIAVRVGALMVGTDDPDVKAASRTIRSLAVRTLDELRQMVGVLRASGGVTEGTDPQPSIADLPALVADSGLAVDLTDTSTRPLSDTLGRAVYRIVQEGLTNVRKHAPGARTTVSIADDGESLVVEVSNAVAHQPPLVLPSAEHGLIGIAERAELLGGYLRTTSPTDRNGFVLRVVLPLQ